MSAVWLGFNRATIIPGDGQLVIFYRVMAFCYAPLFGAGAAAFVLLVWRAYSGGPRFPTQPGHWLLLIGGVAGVVSLGVRAILALTMAGLPGTPLFLAIRVLGLLAAGILYPLAMRDSRGVWRGVFCLGWAITILSLLATMFVAMDMGFRLWMLFQIDQVLQWILTLAVIVAAVIELNSTTRRDYLHWTGIVVRIASTALGIAVPFLIRWLERR